MVVVVAAALVVAIVTTMRIEVFMVMVQSIGILMIVGISLWSW